MLRFSDFFHLPLLDPLIARIIAERRRVTIVTGLASKVATSAAGVGTLLNSRITMVRALVGEILAAWPDAHIAIVGQDRDAIRIPRSRQRRVTFLQVRPNLSYDTQIGQAIRRRPDIVLIDQLDTSNAQAAARDYGL
jgi:hypothetical protein